MRFPETDNYNVRVKSPVPGIFYLRKGLSLRLAIRGATPTSWTFLDSNQGLIAYEATALTTELNVQITDYNGHVSTV